MSHATKENVRRALFIAGTDTDVGKTLVSSLLMRQYGPENPLLHYWKPVQTGSPPDDDGMRVDATAGLHRALPGEQFREPLSPHLAAELEGKQIQLASLLSRLEVLRAEHDLIVEGAGGLCVPLNRKTMWVDFLVEAALPVLLVGRTSIGTINHTLLSVDELRHHGIEIAGLAFCGPAAPDNLRTIAEFTSLPVIGMVDPAGDLSQAIDPARRLAPLLGEAASRIKEHPDRGD